MGGHGAALLAAVLGDARGLSATAGWLRKEAYGDSSARYVHDAAARRVAILFLPPAEASSAAAFARESAR